MRRRVPIAPIAMTMIVVACALIAALAEPAFAEAGADLAAAREQQMRGQSAAAESLASVAIAALEQSSAPDSLMLAESYTLRGNAHMKFGGYADGRALADGTHALAILSWQRGATSAAIAEAELLVGHALQGSDHTDSALVHLQRVVDIRTSALAPDDTLIAEAWDQLALLRRDRREFRVAIETWQKAIAVRARHDGEQSPAVALLQAQTGACWMELGDRVRARQALEGSLATFQRLGLENHPSRWVPLNILADLEKREGNLARDVDLLQEALRIVEITFGEASRQESTLRWNLAAGLTSLNDFEGTREQCELILPHMVAQYGATHVRTMYVRMALAASISRLGDPVQGLRALAQIESTLITIAGPARSVLSQSQKEQGRLLTSLGRPSEALVLLDRARASALAARPVSGSDLSETYFQRILAFAALGDTTALARERRGLDTLQTRFGPQPGFFPSTVLLFAAFADARLGRRDLAWSEALEAEGLAHENNRSNLRRLSDRRGLQYARRSIGELDQVLDLAKGDTARTEVAWDRLARARGLIGTELAQRAVPPGLERDSLVTTAHANWRTGQDALARLMVRGAPADSAARADLEHARSAADEAERLYARALDERGAGLPPIEYGIADERARLRPGQALVSFVTAHAGRDTASVSAFIALGGDPSVYRVELGRVGELNAVVAPWRAALATPPAANRGSAAEAEHACRALGQKVRERVWSPIEAQLARATELFVVADGSLADLPWPALPEHGGRYWVDAGPLVHLIDSERALMSPAGSTGTGRLLAVGAPDFTRSAESPQEGAPVAAELVRSAPDPCSTAGPITLPPLPGSGSEADSVASAWRAANAGSATLLLGAAASEAAFKQAAPGCAVIHLATHGVMLGDRCAAEIVGTRGVGGVAPLAPVGGASKHAQKSEGATPSVPTAEPSPWLSRRVWLALAGANHAAEDVTDENEGFLTAEEVATLDLVGTDWVVLSACHSGAGDAWSGEGRLGMRRAFALAGARSVIASAWALGDASTGEWISALYAARLAGELDAAGAVRDATRRVLAARRASHRPTHPFYWAAFSASAP